MNELLVAALLTSYYGSFSIIDAAIDDGIKEVSGFGNRLDFLKLISDKIKNKDFKGLGEFIPLTIPIVGLFYSPLIASEYKDRIISDCKKYIKPYKCFENNDKVKTYNKTRNVRKRYYE